MAKVICVYRTSTDRQEIESQIQEVVNMAKKDGYTDEDIISIGCKGASAIKLDKNYLAQIQQIYDTIRDEDIACVYAYMLDRIGRNDEILAQFKNRLIENKVNLKVGNMSDSLLDENGNKNSAFELVYSFFGTQAKQEMEDRQQRFKRGKARNFKDGKFNGGFVGFGYKVDANGFIVVDEEKAKVVRLMYELFCTGNYSTSTLAKELNERGYKCERTPFCTSSVSRMLKYKAYTGTYEKDGTTRTIPAIISKEQQEKAGEILRKNNTTQSKSYKHYYFANKLIVCKDCGRHFEAIGSGVYQCAGYALTKRVGYEHLRRCSTNTAIRTGILDGILWEFCKKIMAEELKSNNRNRELEIKEQIEVISHKVKVHKEKLSEYTTTIESIILDGDAGKYSKEFTQKRIAKVNEHKEGDEKKLVALMAELRRLESSIEYENNFRKQVVSYNSISDIELTGDAKVMSQIVHRYISNIAIEKCEYNGSDTFKKIEVTVSRSGGVIYSDGVYTFYFNGKCKKGVKCYLQLPDMDRKKPFMFENIIRKDNQVTTEANERFREFHSILESECSKMKEPQELYKLVEGELSDLYKMVKRDNELRFTHYMSDLYFRIKEANNNKEAGN